MTMTCSVSSKFDLLVSRPKSAIQSKMKLVFSCSFVRMNKKFIVHKSLVPCDAATQSVQQHWMHVR